MCRMQVCVKRTISTSPCTHALYVMIAYIIHCCGRSMQVCGLCCDMSHPRAVAGCCFRHPGPRPKHQCSPAPHRREKGVLDLCLRCLKHEGGLPSPEYHLGHGHRYPLPSRGSTQRRDGRLQRGRSWLRSLLGSTTALLWVEAQRWAVAAQALSEANKRNKVTWWAVAAVRIELT